MTFNEDGCLAKVYDFVAVHTVEVDDQITYSNDLIEVTDKIDSGESILIKGFSHVSGDRVTYIIPSDTEVGLWSV